MKILQISPTYAPAWSFGGVTRVVYNISTELSKRGHDVTVFTTDALDFYSRISTTYKPSIVEGVKVFYLKNINYPLMRSFNIKFSPELLIYSNKYLQDFDIIHFHGYRTMLNIMVHHFTRKYNVPYVIHAHGSLPKMQIKQSLKWLYDTIFGYRFLEDASKVIALSSIEAQQYRRIGVPNEKIAIIPNGIDLSKYSKLPPIGSFKSKFNIPNEKKIIFYLGRIHKIKGLEFLLRTYAYLLKDKKYNDTILIIAGPDEGYLKQMVELASSLGVSDCVLFPGYLKEDEKNSAYIDSTIVVYPGQYEPFGLVSIEAAVFSKPILVAKKTPMAKIVERGGFGLTVEYGNVCEFARILGKMLDSYDELKEIGEKGRRFISENFSWNEIVRKLEKVYESTIIKN